MTLLAGFSYAHDDRSCLEFAAALARSAGESLLVVSVTPAPWPTPVAGHTDREFEVWSADLGRTSVIEAERLLAEIAGDLETKAISVPGRSVPATLLHQAETVGAGMIIVGSGRGGPYGHVHLSSTADRLLHSAHIPIAVATRGYQAGPEGRIGRATCAFRGDEISRDTLARTAELCTAHGAALRVATFAIRGKTMYPPEVGVAAEDAVLQRWIEQSTQAQTQALAEIEQAGDLPTETSTVVASGRSWAAAFDQLTWQRDEVLVVGSSPAGLMQRIFLGSSGSKLLRHSPVPVVVVR